MTALAVTIEDIRAARPFVEQMAIRTPLKPAPKLSARVGRPVHLKLESLQPTGSFKIRGAAAKIVPLTEDARAAGVVTASTGNHGRAVSYVANALGLSATICLSEHVPAGKVDALAGFDCTLDIAGPSQDAAFERATAMSQAPGGPTLVHSILDPVVLAGQGTCGVEICEDLADVGTVIVPVSGGGLMAGVATAVTALAPDARLVGVSMEGGAAMHASLRAGHPVELPEVDTLADSLQGGIGLDNDTTFPIVRELVDDLVLVTEDEIWAGMRHALHEHRLVLEGAGAAGIAALLADRIELADGPVAVVCSGANAELDQVARLATDVPAVAEGWAG